MGIEENKKIAQKFFGVFDGEYFEKIENADDKEAEIAKLLREHRLKYLGENTIIHTPTGEKTFEENITGQIALCTALPDLAYKTEDIISEGNIVMVRYTGSGTFTKPFFNFPPNGKRIFTNGVWIARIENGMMAENWAYYDTLGMGQQMGYVPTN